MKLETYAKKTFLALKNPHRTVIDVRPQIIDEAADFLKHDQTVYYVGVKNTNVIPSALISQLKTAGYLWHTTDAMALGGRAIDINLINPLTTKPMTGSSSGTALNVLYAINDLGIGTDGGGSVLAPACALNLFGFISPLIFDRYQKEPLLKKTSTDGISFTPSIGFITRTFDVMQAAIVAALPLPKRASEEQVSLLVPQEEPNQFVEIKTMLTKLENKSGIQLIRHPLPDIYANRDSLITYLNHTVKPGTILLSMEGPVDQYGIGDSIYGQYDEATKNSQRNSFKGFMRAVNMAQKSAIVIPDCRLGVGILLICESTIDQIDAMLQIACELALPQNELTKSYMMNMNHYFTKQYKEE